MLRVPAAWAGASRPAASTTGYRANNILHATIHHVRPDDVLRAHLEGRGLVKNQMIVDETTSRRGRDGRRLALAVVERRVPTLVAAVQIQQQRQERALVDAGARVAAVLVRPEVVARPVAQDPQPLVEALERVPARAGSRRRRGYGVYSSGDVADPPRIGHVSRRRRGYSVRIPCADRGVAAVASPWVAATPRLRCGSVAGGSRRRRGRDAAPPRLQRS